METRCCWPTERVSGSRAAKERSRPTMSSRRARVGVPSGESRPVEDVFLDRRPEEGGELEDHPDPAPELQEIHPARRFPVQVDLSRARFDQAVQGAEKGALAGPRGPDDGRDPTVRHLGVDALEDLRPAHSVPQPADPDPRVPTLERLPAQVGVEAVVEDVGVAGEGLVVGEGELHPPDYRRPGPRTPGGRTSRP